MTNLGSNTVSVIATASNTLVATVPGLGTAPSGVAVTPDGTRVYVANQVSNTVSVIATATNTVVATVPVGSFPTALGKFIQPVAVIPPVAAVAFAFFAPKVEIEGDKLEVKAPFSLGTDTDGIDPVTEIVQLELTGGTGSFSTTIPAGSFQFQPAKFNKKGKQVKPPQFKFEGVIDGVTLEAKITDLGNDNFEFKAEAKGANLAGLANPVTVILTIGNDSGTATVEADFE